MSAVVHLNLKDLDLETLEFHQQNLLQSIEELVEKQKATPHAHVGFKKLLRVKRMELKSIERMIDSIRQLQ